MGRVSQPVSACVFLVAIIVWASAATTASAQEERLTAFMQGWSPQGNVDLPIVEERIEVVIDAQHARTRVQQTYRNNTNGRVEGLYSLQAGASAQVEGFAYWNGEEKIVGEVFERDTARAIYNDITSRQRDPGLLEQVGEGAFQFKVFPIEAREEKRVEVTYSRWLELHGNEVLFRAPVRHDAASISITLQDERGIANIRSSTHHLVTERLVGGGTRIRADQRGRATELVLRYEVQRHAWQLAAQVHRDPGEDAYFNLALGAPATYDNRRIAKNVVLVIDRSGSMSGDPLSHAKDAAAGVVQQLQPDDGINVVSFDDDSDALFERAQRGPEARAQALDFIARLGPGGGTDIAGALRRALSGRGLPAATSSLSGQSERPTVVVLITDGQSEAQLALTAAEEDRSDARIFTVGVGDGVDRALLARLAKTKRGRFLFIQNASEIEEHVSRLYKQLARPLLLDVSLHVDGARGYGTYPRSLPDLYVDDELRVSGRLSGSAPAVLRIQGVLDGRPVEFQTRIELPPSHKRPWVGRLWARSRVDDLLEEIALNGERSELTEEVIGLSLAYNFVTPYTAFLAVPQSEMVGDIATRIGDARALKAKFLARHRDAQALGGLAAGAPVDVIDRRQLDPSVATTMADVVQSMEPGSGSGFNADGDELVVTGSRIKRTSFSSASAVEVVERRQLELSGARTMADVVRNLSVATGAARDYEVPSGGSAEVRLGLEGLRLEQGVVLVNGLRVMRGESGWSLLELLPLSAVQRIEVLHSGSAKYGDATGVVINIITRSGLSSVLLNAQGHSGADLAQGGGELSLLWGASAERSRVMLGLGYRGHSALSAAERDVTRGGYSTGLGRPGNFALLDDSGHVESLVGDPDCEQAGAGNLDDSGRCVLDARRETDLVAEQHDVQAFGEAGYDLSDYTTLQSELLYGQHISTARRAAQWPAQRWPVLSAEHPDNPFAQDAAVVGSAIGAPGAATEQQDRHDHLRVALQLHGDLGGVAAAPWEDWEWSVYGVHSRRDHDSRSDDLLAEPLQLALDGCEDGGQCLDPLYGAQLSGDNGEPLLQSLRSEVSKQVQASRWDTGFAMSGPLLELPGGDLVLAWGAEYRNERREADLDAVSNALGHVYSVGFTDSKRSRDEGSAYGKLLLPVLAGLELQLAGRFASVEGAGSKLTPVLGLLLTPAYLLGDLGDEQGGAPRWQLRVQYSQTWRAASLRELGQDGFATDQVVLAGSGRVVPVRALGNPELKPEQGQRLTFGTTVDYERLELELGAWHSRFRDLIVHESAQALHDELLETGSADCVLSKQGQPCLLLQGDDGSADSLMSIATSLRNLEQLHSTGVHARLGYRWELGTTVLNLAVHGQYLISQQQRDGGRSIELAGRRNLAVHGGSPLPRLRLRVPLQWTLSEHTLWTTVHFTSGYKDDAAQLGTGLLGHHIDSHTTLDLGYRFATDLDNHPASLGLSILNLLDTAPPGAWGLGHFDPITHDPAGRTLVLNASLEF